MSKQFAPFIALFTVLLTSSPFLSGFAQKNPPFSYEIQLFKKKDSLSFPEPGQILLIGSSSFTMWKDVQDYFPRKKILNRGFGGSSLPDLIRYQEDIIYPYKPSRIVIYCGENDFAASDTISVATVVDRFRTLFADIRYRLLQVPVIYVSMKPSPSRMHLMPKMEEANAAIRLFLKAQVRARYVDVYYPMLNKEGRPKPELFLADSLHMNAKGYKIWQKKMKRKI